MATNILYRTTVPLAPSNTAYKGVALTNAELDGNFLSLANSVDAKGNLAGGNTWTGDQTLSTGNFNIGISGYGKLSVNGNIGGDNFVINSQATTSAGTFGFTNSNGPGVVAWGNTSAGAGMLEFYTNGVSRLKINSTGQLVGAKQINASIVFLDKGNSGTTTQTIDYSAGSHQKITATGNHTIAFSNWPTAGYTANLMLELTNGGAFTITWPTVNWVKSDGSFTTTFSNSGITLQSSGTDFALFWTRDGGTTVYGKFMR